MTGGTQYDGTQLGFTWKRPLREPIGTFERSILLGALFLVVVALLLTVLLQDPYLLACIPLPLLFMAAFSQEWSGRVRFVCFLHATLGVRPRHWPAWSLQENSLQATAHKHFERQLRREDEDTQEIARSLVEGFQGTLDELLQTSRRLAGPTRTQSLLRQLLP